MSVDALFGEYTSAGTLVAEDEFRDFRKFLFAVWDHLNLPAPTPVQYDIAHYLQHGPRRQIIMAFRGVGKSWITSAFVCWVLYMNPQLKILVVSASKERSDNFTNFTKQLIADMPELQHLRPRPHQRNSTVSFDVGPARADHAPSVKAAGITGQLAGSRADIIVPDDIEVPNNSATEIAREQLSERVKEFDAILKPGGLNRFLGTPQTEMSVYNKLAERGYSVRIWPIQYPDSKRLEGYNGRLAPMLEKRITAMPHLKNSSTDPDRFDNIDIMERATSYGRSGFALQFLLDTSLSDAERYPLKVADLVVMNLNHEVAHEKVVWAASAELVHNDLPNVAFPGDKFYGPMDLVKPTREYTGSMMAVDPSGRGTDETAYCVAKVLNSQIFITRLGATPSGYGEDTMKMLAQIAKEEGVNLILVEKNFGDGMFSQLLRPYVTQETGGTTIEDIHNTKQKELRIIDTLEPVMNQHRLVIDKKIIEQDHKSGEGRPPEEALKYQLIHQLTRITKERGALAKDDKLDALSMAVGYWVDAMAKDIDKSRDHRREREIEKEIRLMEERIKKGLGTAVYWDKKSTERKSRRTIGAGRMKRRR